MLNEPMCYERNCRHFIGAHQPAGNEIGETVICRAFSSRIPEDIAYGDNLHLVEVKGDNGITYEKATDTHDMNVGPELREGES